MTRKDLDNQISAILENHGAFFAFSGKQFDEQAKPGTKYVNCGAGLICPKGKTDAFFEDMDKATDAYHKSVLENTPRKDLIWSELANYECQINVDPSPAIDALSVYGITAEEVKAEWPAYFQNCVDNDYF